MTEVLEKLLKIFVPTERDLVSDRYIYEISFGYGHLRLLAESG
jgi:hypothetical protein